jgi:hypothetical protein
MIVEMTRDNGKRWTRLSIHDRSPLANQIRQTSPGSDGLWTDEITNMKYRLIED